MGKWSHDDIQDAGLLLVKNNCIKMIVCSAQPASYAEANTLYDGTAGKYKLAELVISDADFTGPATNGDTGGRVLTIPAKADIPVLATADASHVALCDSNTLRYVTTCTPQGVTAGNTVTVPEWKIEIADPI